MKRRVLLAAIGSSAIAGCQSLATNNGRETAGSRADVNGSSKGATSVHIHNETNEPVTLSMVVTDTDDETRLDETVTVDPLDEVDPFDEHHLGLLPEGTDYTVTIDVENGPSETFQWQDVRIGLAPLHVIIDGSSDLLFTLGAGKTTKGEYGTNRGETNGTTSLDIHNERNKTVSLSLSVANTDEKTLLNETFTLNPLDVVDPITEQGRSKLAAGGDYTVTIDIEGGGSWSFQWQDVWLKLAPLHVLIAEESRLLYTLETD
jgi:hypothetical protein